MQNTFLAPRVVRDVEDRGHLDHDVSSPPLSAPRALARVSFGRRASACPSTSDAPRRSRRGRRPWHVVRSRRAPCTSRARSMNLWNRRVADAADDRDDHGLLHLVGRDGADRARGARRGVVARSARLLRRLGHDCFCFASALSTAACFSVPRSRAATGPSGCARSRGASSRIASVVRRAGSCSCLSWSWNSSSASRASAPCSSSSVDSRSVVEVASSSSLTGTSSRDDDAGRDRQLVVRAGGTPRCAISSSTPSIS